MKTLLSSRKIAALLLVSGIFILNSCQDEFPDPDLLPKGLTGSWVEIHTKNDTITFTSDADAGIFLLQKGYENRNGYRLPVIGSGPYEYEISSNSVIVRDCLSSTWSEISYYYNFNEQDLIIRIGKFSEYIDVNKSILTFRKIK